VEQPVAPVFVQSFEPSSLKEMRRKGLKTRMVQLVDGDDIDLKTGKITYAIPFDRPYDWCKSAMTACLPTWLRHRPG